MIKKYVFSSNITKRVIKSDDVEDENV